MPPHDDDGDVVVGVGDGDVVVGVGDGDVVLVVGVGDGDDVVDVGDGDGLGLCPGADAGLAAAATFCAAMAKQIKARPAATRRA